LLNGLLIKQYEATIVENDGFVFVDLFLQYLDTFALKRLSRERLRGDISPLIGKRARLRPFRCFHAAWRESKCTDQQDGKRRIQTER
jgi:hypothetical protein